MVHILGAFFISIFGTLNHFIYGWSKKNKVVGLFTAVNESTWEHIKLALFPSFLWLIIDIYKYGIVSFFPRFISILFIILFIPILYYFIQSIIKKEIVIVDVLEFYLAIFLEQFIFWKILSLNLNNILFIVLGIIGLLIILILFFTFTIKPLNNFIFIDPITKKYGYEGGNYEKHN